MPQLLHASSSSQLSPFLSTKLPLLAETVRSASCSKPFCQAARGQSPISTASLCSVPRPRHTARFNKSFLGAGPAFQPSAGLLASPIKPVSVLKSERKHISMAALPEQMKAWQYGKYGGGASSLEAVEVPVPKPGPYELLLKIHASSVNPVDWKLQSGALKLLVPLKLPIIPGTDFAGEIVAVGSEIITFKVGERVLVKTDVKKQGAFADYVAVETSTIARMPSGVSYEDASGLPVAGMTALQGLIKGGLSFPKGSGRVLIQAASGGVGHYAVQLAKYAGAHVTATSSARNIDLLKRLGADEVLDYKKVSDPSNPFQSSSKEPYDVILHCSSTPVPWAHWQKVLSKNGKVVSFTPGAGYFLRAALQFVTFSGQRVIPLILSANSKDLQMLVDLVAEKKIETVVDSKYPLSDVKKAWERSIDGHSVGKVVVSVD